MKNTMTRQNFRNYGNRMNKTLAITAMIALVNFGMKAFGFLQSLVTVGSTPFAGLNRGQLRQMSWLFAMYRV